MEKERFLSLPSSEIARSLGQMLPKVCAFPINGTRRWFMLEQPTGDYLDVMCRTHINLYRMFFDHGIDTLLTPAFGPDLIERGSDYTQIAIKGLARLANHQDFLNFYDEYDVRVRCYGDYRKFFTGTDFEYLCDLFDEVSETTQNHQKHRLFYGVCAQDAVQTTAELSIHHYLKNGRVPDKNKLIELYYGEYVPPLDIFIGFDKFCTFDTPLITTGNEDLYFTVSPSLYFTETQLREILYDHLYTRTSKETDYSEMTREDWDVMRRFYDTNRGKTLGIGAKQARGEFWYPLPQVTLPDEFLEPVLQD
jgi:tuberculosinol/isotuberculosinol synthase